MTRSAHGAESLGLKSGARTSALRDVIALTKPGITRMVVVTTGAGFALAALSRAWTLPEFIVTAGACLVATALSAGGANALNQWAERDLDALMRRTCERPVPAKRLRPETGLSVGLLLSALGVSLLLIGVNAAAAAISAATIASYVLVYTPLKPRTSLATIIGAVPGALPPMIGWAAAGGREEGWAYAAQLGGWSVFLVLFVWQIPHFLAIAWRSREDYARAGHRVMTVGDPSGSATAWTALIWTVALVAASVTPALLIESVSGWLYLPAAALLGVMFLRASAGFVRDHSDRAARRLFFASIIYLPALLFALVGDAVLTTAL